LYGFDAIAAHNGWAMALAGALIVLSGLAVLSFVISQLHKVVALLEKREEKPSEKPVAGKKPPKPATAPKKPLLDADAFKDKYQSLTEELDEPFELSRLYALAVAGNLPHVHLTIRTLRETGILVSVGDGKFKWQD
jgi:hypothetical protein